MADIITSMVMRSVSYHEQLAAVSAGVPLANPPQVRSLLEPPFSKTMFALRAHLREARAPSNQLTGSDLVNS
jgi:hypothetical protein